MLAEQELLAGDGEAAAEHFGQLLEQGAIAPPGEFSPRAELEERVAVAVRTAGSGRPALAAEQPADALVDAYSLVDAEDPWLLRLRYSHAATVGYSGRYAEAIDLLRAVMKDMDAAVGPFDADARDCREVLARLLYRAGERRDACSIVEELYGLSLRVEGPSAPPRPFVPTTCVRTGRAGVRSPSGSAADRRTTGWAHCEGRAVSERRKPAQSSLDEPTSRFSASTHVSHSGRHRAWVNLVAGRPSSSLGAQRAARLTTRGRRRVMPPRDPVPSTSQDRVAHQGVQLGTAARHPGSKVPEITVVFWIIKILTTGMGETASDFLAHTIGPLASVPLGFVGLSVAFVIQMRARTYVAWKYWLAVVMVSVFGTMAADVLHVGIGIPYIVSTTAFAITLAVILWQWHTREGTLSIHSIHTKRRELFYWATVLATFALGTAAGDMTAVTFGWGYLTSGIVFAILFAIPLLAQSRWGAPEVAMFWTAYIITRPLGASFADWLAVPPARGGLDLGTGPVTVLWGAAIALLVGYLAYTRRDVDDDDPALA